ncbi:MAG: MltA domain-containing protein [Bdellovibrionales bacterium]|nr:MltA domain-containing protein [Bdellovibrionales bacterium]
MKTLTILLCLLFVGCSQSRKQKTVATQPAADWQRVDWPNQFVDNAGRASLIRAIDLHLAYWSRRSTKVISLGGFRYSGSDYLSALKTAKSRLKAGRSVSETFTQLFEVVARAEQGAEYRALLTSYYEPVIQASKFRNERFFQPLYEKPDSLVSVSLKSYERVFPRWSLWQVPAPNRMRGRLTDGNTVVPFYSRKQIDTQGLLTGQAKVIGYVDPVDAFFLQIQGSGSLRFGADKMQTVSYANQNGHDYFAIGRALLNVIPREKMSMAAIREALMAMEPRQRYEFMNLNPSYVFFRKLKGRGQTSLGTEVVDGRTLASDPKSYPRGHFSLLQFRVKGLGLKIKDVASQVVVHQDTGGAIKGALRADLFWGRGAEAESIAGKVKNPARIFVLVPKPASGLE